MDAAEKHGRDGNGDRIPREARRCRDGLAASWVREPERAVSWDAVATFVLAFVTLVGLNLGAMRWMLGQYGAELGSRLDAIKHDGSEFSHSVDREVLKLKAQLPVDYVRREDWIRFSNTLEAKLDALRAEMRAEISELRERMYERSQKSTAEETTL